MTEYSKQQNPVISIEGKLVLVVDDSPESLGMLTSALEEAGLTVLVALGGNQAISITQKIVPNIILLDAVMPNMDGFETCKQLKGNPRLTNIPIIFMTGLEDKQSTIRGLESGGSDYLTKPVDVDELIARMRVHLGASQLTSSAQIALDNAGQHLFTVNEKFQTVWATPLTKEVFYRAKLTDQWLEFDLPKQIANWLSSKPNTGEEFDIENTGRKLRARLMEHTTNNEVLFKLIDQTIVRGPETLEKKLPITKRESEVLYWISNGKANDEIGQILDTSPRTINKHLEHIFTKLHISNRTSAAAIAIRALDTT